MSYYRHEKVEPVPDDGIARAYGYIPGEGQQETDSDGQLWSYPHPFTGNGGDDEYEELDLPRMLLEIKMCAMSNEIREKERWWEKMKDAEIVDRWREEIVQAEKSEENPRWRLSEKMISYVLQELKGYAALRDAETGIEIGCWERVWRSSSLIGPDFRQDLLCAVSLLESSSEPDWHPGSSGLVRDLVHPSLYPIIYNQTLFWNDESKTLESVLPPSEIASGPDTLNGTHISEQFCWLPSDFAVSNTGEVTLISPYINNLDPRAHASVYPVITRLVQSAVPLWERVLSDLRAPLSPVRFRQDTNSYGDCYDRDVMTVRCIWKNMDIPYPGPEQWAAYHEDEEAWFHTQIDKQQLPEPLEAYDGALERTVKKTVSLAGSTVQVIAKLANIELTPEKPDYAGGTWHVEGMENEHIVSTFIYYYDEENIIRSQLSFRTGTCQPVYHCQHDSYCMQQLYGLTLDSICVQSRGSVSTTQGLCLAFPNIYQHCVSPFSLIDRTKPGHRKIVALFLVDPVMTQLGAVKSATQVLPQQLDLYQGPVLQERSLFCKLPFELRDRILGELRSDGGKMTRKEAEEVRLAFMKERTQDASRWEGEDSFFGMRFNMCEH